MAEMTKSKDMTPYDFREMEKRDEDQILAELRGELVDEMIYQFPREGKTVTGISWMGIKEIARRYGKIDVNLVHFEDVGDSFMVVVKAVDIEKGTGLLGTSTQPKMMKKRDGSETPDTFCVQKAMSKAQRNAIRSIIPEAYFKAVFAELAKDHPPSKTRGRQVKPEAKVPKPVESTQRDVASKGVPAFKNGKGAVVKAITAEQVRAHLESIVEDVLLHVDDEGNHFEAKPTKYLGDNWGPINDVVRNLGGRWVKDEANKADSHWWIPKDESEQPAEAQVNPFTTFLSEVQSIGELEYLLDSKFAGASDMFTVTEDADDFEVEPMTALDEEIVKETTALIEKVGGSYREVPGGVGYVWYIKKKA